MLEDIMKKVKCRRAFTLAEVLLTLTIIGIIAVLTLPQLTSKHALKTKKAILRKTVAELSQMNQLAATEKNIKFNQTGSNDISNCSSTTYFPNTISICAIMNSKLKNIQFVGKGSYGTPVFKLSSGANVTLSNWRGQPSVFIVPRYKDLKSSTTFSTCNSGDCASADGFEFNLYEDGTLKPANEAVSKFMEE